jgi:N-acetylglucosamine-6-sulfatase
MRKSALLLALEVSALSMARFDEAFRTLKGPLAKRTALVLLLGITAVWASEASPRAVEATPKPNILFILTDDQDEESIARMSKLQDRLVDRGTRFPNSFVTTPLCCPSRASFLRGQYAHNHRVLSNNPPLGGFQTLRNRGLEDSTVATWLHGAGYATGYTGKYLNGYGEDSPTRYVPPGWDRWWVRTGGNRDKTYAINENGKKIKTYNRNELHETDYYSQRAEQFVRDHGGAGPPWFLVVATSSPHHPSWAARRYEDMFRRVKMPEPPSFNEADVSDKPEWIRRKPRLGGREIDEAKKEWRQRQRSLQSVDDLVGNVLRILAETGQLDETYVVYASDNGWLHYRHRVKGKGVPYEESIGVPLIVRGPDVPAGAVRKQLVANIDWAPTIAEWAGVTPPRFVDGRSFAPLLSERPPGDWRERLLIEFLKGQHAFRGLRTADGETYVEYEETGEREYYDLQADPWQVESAHRASGNAKRLRALSGHLSDLETCAGMTCWEGEDAP